MHTYAARLIDVLAGDLVELEVDLGFGIRARQVMGLLGVDAPAPSGPTEEAGCAAAEYLFDLLADKELVIRTERIAEMDYYVARINAEGLDVNRALVEAGHAAAARPRQRPR